VVTAAFGSASRLPTGATALPPISEADDLCFKRARELTTLIRSGKLSARIVVDRGPSRGCTGCRIGTATFFLRCSRASIGRVSHLNPERGSGPAEPFVRSALAHVGNNHEGSIPFTQVFRLAKFIRTVSKNVSNGVVKGSEMTKGVFLLITVSCSLCSLCRECFGGVERRRGDAGAAATKTSVERKANPRR